MEEKINKVVSSEQKFRSEWVLKKLCLVKEGARLRPLLPMVSLLIRHCRESATSLPQPQPPGPSALCPWWFMPSLLFFQPTFSPCTSLSV